MIGKENCAYFLPIQFRGPTLKACKDSMMLPFVLAVSLSSRKRAGLKTQGSTQLSELWFMDHCWTSTSVCVIKISTNIHISTAIGSK